MGFSRDVHAAGFAPSSRAVTLPPLSDPSPGLVFAAALVAPVLVTFHRRPPLVLPSSFRLSCRRLWAQSTSQLACLFIISYVALVLPLAFLCQGIIHSLGFPCTARTRIT